MKAIFTKQTLKARKSRITCIICTASANLLHNARFRQQEIRDTNPDFSLGTMVDMDEKLEQIIVEATNGLKAELKVAQGEQGAQGTKPHDTGCSHVAIEPSSENSKRTALQAPHMGDKQLAALIRTANKGISRNEDHIAKKHLMPFYLHIRQNDPARWERWGIDPATEERLLQLLLVKPRRTASGVATISVITKPWPCACNCLYCPNDLRMPKSYISDEPACQRAERNWFDPYLQVASRLKALREMGHVTDKVELIILGGTWNDYPAAYRCWFVSELFRALNEAAEPEHAAQQAAERRARYENAGIPCTEASCADYVSAVQKRVNSHELTYNQAFSLLYGEASPWSAVETWQRAGLEEVERLHTANEQAAHRVVGLVMETRPDAVNVDAFIEMRRLGCTKVQMGIQSLNAHLLQQNRRGIPSEDIRRAFELARLCGFKTHAHFMVNLLGATPASDKADYLNFVSDPALAPDEVKLYPCALVAGTDLETRFEQGVWRPYTEAELMDVLASDLLATPEYCRVSRMIRDIPANNILVGNKKINLRQMVEAEADRRAAAEGAPVREIRHREISVQGTGNDKLRLDEVRYETSVSREVFLQWVTPENRIAGFLRLSLPHADALKQVRNEAAKGVFPIGTGEAMIREVHVYGRVAGLHRTSGGAQHQGLGRALIERACTLAKQEGYTALNVISAVGTRDYYRRQGFADNGLYQQRPLQ